MHEGNGKRETAEHQETSAVSVLMSTSIIAQQCESNSNPKGQVETSCPSCPSAILPPQCSAQTSASSPWVTMTSFGYIHRRHCLRERGEQGGFHCYQLDAPSASPQNALSDATLRGVTGHGPPPRASCCWLRGSVGRFVIIGFPLIVTQNPPSLTGRGNGVGEGMGGLKRYEATPSLQLCHKLRVGRRSGGICEQTRPPLNTMSRCQWLGKRLRRGSCEWFSLGRSGLCLVSCDFA